MGCDLRYRVRQRNCRKLRTARESISAYDLNAFGKKDRFKIGAVGERVISDRSHSGKDRHLFDLGTVRIPRSRARRNGDALHVKVQKKSFCLDAVEADI